MKQSKKAKQAISRQREAIVHAVLALSFFGLSQVLLYHGFIGLGVMPLLMSLFLAVLLIFDLRDLIKAKRQKT